MAFAVVPFQLWLYIRWKWCREKRRDQPTGVTVWMYWMLCLVMLILYYTTHIYLYFVLQEIANNLARLSVDALARLGGYLCKWIKIFRAPFNVNTPAPKGITLAKRNTCKRYCKWTNQLLKLVYQAGPKRGKIHVTRSQLVEPDWLRKWRDIF